MLFKFHEGKKASEASRDIITVYGKDASNKRTCQWWFSRFKEGNFDLNDESRTGRPSKLLDDQLEGLLAEDPCQTEEELSKQLEVNQSTISRHLKKLGKISKAGKWVPHALSEANKSLRLSTCISLAAKQKKKSFLHQIVTGDESWVYYENPVRKRQWLSPGQPARSTPKSGLHPKKSFSAFGGITKVFYIMNCFLKAKQLMLNVTPLNSGV